MTAGRRGIVVAVAITCLSVLVAGPADAASSRRRTRHVTTGSHWWNRAHWSATTTANTARGTRDGGRLCADSLPKGADYRIYAYDSRGRVLASRGENHAHFGQCRSLVAPQRTVRFLFRVNTYGDGAGERAWSMAATR